MAKELVIICPHGAEKPKHAIIPMAIATAAQVLDVEVVMGIQANGVTRASKGVAETFGIRFGAGARWSAPGRMLPLTPAAC